jgi:predicted nucleic acid-binding protein
MNYLFDSNILIYHLNGQLNARATQLLGDGISGDGAYSIISKIELLGFNQSREQEVQARSLLSRLQEIELSSAIAEETIQLRKSRKIKLPDAVIAASALVLNLTIVTRNIDDFNRISGLNLINPWD